MFVFWLGGVNDCSRMVYQHSFIESECTYSKGWTTDTPSADKSDLDTTKDLMSEDGFENKAESRHAGDHQN